MQFVFSIFAGVLFLVVRTLSSPYEFDEEITKSLHQIEVYSDDLELMEARLGTLGTEEETFINAEYVVEKAVGYPWEDFEVERRQTSSTPCTDKSPYCISYIRIYGLDPPLTLCDDDWFISDDGWYGCKQSCNLC